MRTTLTLDDQLAQTLKDVAYRSGKPFKVVVNETLRRGLEAAARPPARRYTLSPSSLGGVLPGVDLRKALRIADDLEDRAIAGKLTLRK